jgi:hypothetical protein
MKISGMISVLSTEMGIRALTTNDKVGGVRVCTEMYGGEHIEKMRRRGIFHCRIFNY